VRDNFISMAVEIFVTVPLFRSIWSGFWALQKKYAVLNVRHSTKFKIAIKLAYPFKNPSLDRGTSEALVQIYEL
jgi:hypothetical protein